MEEDSLTEQQAPRPVAVWLVWLAAYVIWVVVLGLIPLFDIDPEYAVFPPLLTALAGLFVATAINVRPEAVEGEDDWNRVQTHSVVAGITSMVCSIVLVMCVIAFPGEVLARIAFWSSGFAILTTAAFLLSTVWDRLVPDPAKPEVNTPAEEIANEEPVVEEEAPVVAPVTKPKKSAKKSGKKKQKKKKDSKKKDSKKKK